MILNIFIKNEMSHPPVVVRDLQLVKGSGQGSLFFVDPLFNFGSHCPSLRLAGELLAAN